MFKIGSSIMLNGKSWKVTGYMKNPAGKWQMRIERRDQVRRIKLSDVEAAITNTNEEK